MIYNRIDEQWRHRVDDITVAVKNTEFSAGDFGGTRFGSLSDAKNHERIEMIPRTPKSGQYVKVWIPGSGETLQICEVEVFRAQGIY